MTKQKIECSSDAIREKTLNFLVDICGKSVDSSSIPQKNKNEQVYRASSTLGSSITITHSHENETINYVDFKITPSKFCKIIYIILGILFFLGIVILLTSVAIPFTIGPTLSRLINQDVIFIMRPVMLTGLVASLLAIPLFLSRFHLAHIEKSFWKEINKIPLKSLTLIEGSFKPNKEKSFVNKLISLIMLFIFLQISFDYNMIPILVTLWVTGTFLLEHSSLFFFKNSETYKRSLIYSRSLLIPLRISLVFTFNVLLLLYFSGILGSLLETNATLQSTPTYNNNLFNKRFKKSLPEFEFNDTLKKFMPITSTDGQFFNLNQSASYDNFGTTIFELLKHTTREDMMNKGIVFCSIAILVPSIYMIVFILYGSLFMQLRKSKADIQDNYGDINKLKFKSGNNHIASVVFNIWSFTMWCFMNLFVIYSIALYTTVLLWSFGYDYPQTFSYVIIPFSLIKASIINVFGNQGTMIYLIIVILGFIPLIIAYLLPIYRTLFVFFRRLRIFSSKLIPISQLNILDEGLVKKISIVKLRITNQGQFGHMTHPYSFWFFIPVVVLPQKYLDLLNSENDENRAYVKFVILHEIGHFVQWKKLFFFQLLDRFSFSGEGYLENHINSKKQEHDADKFSFTNLSDKERKLTTTHSLQIHNGIVHEHNAQTNNSPFTNSKYGYIHPKLSDRIKHLNYYFIADNKKNITSLSPRKRLLYFNLSSFIAALLLWCIVGIPLSYFSGQESISNKKFITETHANWTKSPPLKKPIEITGIEYLNGHIYISSKDGVYRTDPESSQLDQLICHNKILTEPISLIHKDNNRLYFSDKKVIYILENNNVYRQTILPLNIDIYKDKEISIGNFIPVGDNNFMFSSYQGLAYFTPSKRKWIFLDKPHTTHSDQYAFWKTGDRFRALKYYNDYVEFWFEGTEIKSKTIENKTRPAFIDNQNSPWFLIKNEDKKDIQSPYKWGNCKTVTLKNYSPKEVYVHSDKAFLLFQHWKNKENGRLLIVSNNSSEVFDFTIPTSDKITGLAVSKKGRIFFSTYKSGIYEILNNKVFPLKSTRFIK